MLNGCPFSDEPPWILFVQGLINFEQFHRHLILSERRHCWNQLTSIFTFSNHCEPFHLTCHCSFDRTAGLVTAIQSHGEKVWSKTQASKFWRTPEYPCCRSWTFARLRPLPWRKLRKKQCLKTPALLGSVQETGCCILPLSARAYLEWHKLAIGTLQGHFQSDSVLDDGVSKVTWKFEQSDCNLDLSLI